jgi:hypothetical protein
VNLVGYLASIDLRRRWRSWAGIALLLGLTAGASMLALAGARRTASSYSRFLRSVNPSAIIVTSSGGYSPEANAKVANEPGVTASRTAVGFSVSVLENGLPRLTTQDFEADGTFDGRFFDQDRFVATAGRAPNRDRSDEVAVNEAAAMRFGFRVGQQLDLGTYSLEQISSRSFFTDPPPPKLTTHATIVGIGRFPDEVLQDDGDRSIRMLLTPAYSAQARRWTNYGIQGLVLSGNKPDIESVRARIEAQSPPGSIEFRVTAVDAFHAQQAMRPLALALAVFGAIVAGASLVLTAQAIARTLRADRHTPTVARTLGAKSTALAGAAMIAPLITVAIGALLAVALALAASPVMPIGSVRAVDPARGFDADLTVLGIGALAIVLVLGAYTIAVSVRSAHMPNRRAPRHQSRTIAIAANAGLGAPALTGLRFAIEPGGGMRSASTRSVIGGAIVAVTTLIAAITFGASLNALVHKPPLYGWHGTAVITAAQGYGNIRLDGAHQILDHDTNISAWTGATFGRAKVNGREVPVLGIAPGSAVAPPIVRGRTPSADNEIVLGRTSAANVHAAIGDTVTFAGGDKPARLRVVGLATFPTIGKVHAAHTSLGVGAWLAPKLVPGANRDITGKVNAKLGPRAIFIRFRDHTDTNAAIARLRTTTRPLAGFGGLDILPVQRPAEIVNSSQIGRSPVLFALALGLGALVSLGLALGSSVRRHRRDLALLKTLGFTRRQVAATVACHATAATLIALLIGVPLGIAIGRALWTLFAQQLDVVVQPSISLIGLLVIIGTALLAANTTAAVPARAARRVSPSLLLRSE